MPDHVVENGDCIWSLAMGSGHFWETIWNDSNNSGLREKRRDPNVLFVGDVVHIPERVEKQEAGATEKRHRFRRKGVPVKFRIQMLRDGKPRASRPYRITIDGSSREGKTDGNGWIETSIPPGAREGRLVMGEEIYELNLGHLDPIDETKGVQQRLQNLGYYGGAIDGQAGTLTQGALAMFQRDEGLPANGRMDDATRDALMKAHHA